MRPAPADMPAGAAPGESAAESSPPWVVFEIDGEAHGLPSRAVESVATVGSTTPLPFAPAAVEGLFNDRGRIVPVVSLRALLWPTRAAPGYDSEGEGGEPPCILVRFADRIFALRVGRLLFVGAGRDVREPPDARHPMVERVMEARGRRVSCLSLDRLGLTALRPRTPPAGTPGPIAAAPAAKTRFALRGALAAERRAVIAVRAAGSVFGLPLPVVVELRERQSATPLPLVPPVLAGIAMRRGAPLLVFSLARLLGLGAGGDEEQASSHVIVRAGGGLLGLAVDEILGLQLLSLRRGIAAPGGDAASRPSAVEHVLEVADLIEPALLAMIGAMPKAAPGRGPGGGNGPQPGSKALSLLCVVIAGRLCALPLEAVDRVIEPRPVMRVPAGAGAAVDGGVELEGAMLPLTDGRRWLGAGGAAAGPYVVLRGEHGRHVLAVDEVRRIAAVPERDVVAIAGAAEGRISAVARVAGQPALLLAPSLLTSPAAMRPGRPAPAS